MSNRLVLRYSVVGVALICVFLLIAIKNQPLPNQLTKTGHSRNRFHHNKNNLNLGRKAGRQPQGIDMYKDFKEEPEDLSYDDYSSYFYGSSESVSISSSFYGNRSRIQTSYSSSSDSWIDPQDVKFVEDLKLKFKQQRQAKIKRKKEQRAKKLGAVANKDAPAAANVRMRNGQMIDEDGNVIKMAQKHKGDHKEGKPRNRRSLEGMDEAELEAFKTAVELRQKERQERMKDYCEGRSGKGLASELSDYTKKHILVIPEYHVMYCFVPKAGCSNWKRIMMVLTGQRDSVDGFTSDEVHLNAKFQFFSGLPPAQQQEALETYYKFTFVRDPMERLLSVYRNKFGDKVYYRKNKSFHSFGKGIIKHFRQNSTRHQKISGEGVTWREFTKYLLTPQVRKKFESGQDVHRKDHWDVQTTITSPCEVGYDFIGQMETIDQDATYLLRHWGVHENVEYLSSNTSRPTNSNDREVFERNFGMLTSEQRERLYGLFRDDYEAFGFKKPSFIN